MKVLLKSHVLTSEIVEILHLGIFVYSHNFQMFCEPKTQEQIALVDTINTPSQAGFSNKKK